jgi:hypothetical protein
MGEDISNIKEEMTQALTQGYGSKIARFVLALLGGISPRFCPA